MSGIMYTFFRGRWYTYFLVTWVEHHKLNETTPFGAVWMRFDVTLGLRHKHTQINTYNIILISSSSSGHSSSIDYHEIDPTWASWITFQWIEYMINDMKMMMNEYDVKGVTLCLCTCVPSWTPTTQPNGPVTGRLVEFLVFSSIHKKKIVLATAENMYLMDVMNSTILKS